MSLKVTFDLNDRDLRYFRRMLAEVTDRCAELEESDILENAAELLASMPEDVPEFVSERLERLHALIEMLRDEEWRLEGRDRSRVVKALTYFAEPHDIIPDTVPGIGFLDDAIMVELVVREITHEIDAYEDFCKFRSQKDRLLKKGRQDPTFREEWLEARRAQLQSRMRRRRRRTRESSGGRARRGRQSLW